MASLSKVKSGDLLTPEHWNNLIQLVSSQDRVIKKLEQRVKRLEDNERKPINMVCTIQQRSNSRFLDAHEHEREDYRVVTRPNQNNNTQRWLIRSL